MLGFIIFLCVVGLLIAVFFIVKEIYKRFAIKYSVRLKKLDEINCKFTFYPFVSNDLSHTYDNEKFFDNISEEDYLTYQLQFISSKVIEQIKLMEFNKDYYVKYKAEVDKLTTVSYEKESKIIIWKFMNMLEEQEFEKRKKKPCIDYSIRVVLSLSKINGQIYKRKQYTFNSKQIQSIMNRLKNKKGKFYNDRGIWDSICRVERGKVSNKMRFAVYQRDGYRCKYCGKTQNRALLEVDHIYPIAKGGKTTFDNLQTLCHNCNVKKGSDVYE